MIRNGNDKFKMIGFTFFFNNNFGLIAGILTRKTIRIRQTLAYPLKDPECHDYLFFSVEGVYDSSASEGAVTRSQLKFSPEVGHVGGILLCKAMTTRRDSIRKTQFTHLDQNISLTKLNLKNCIFVRDASAAARHTRVIDEKMFCRKSVLADIYFFQCGLSVS